MIDRIARLSLAVIGTALFALGVHAFYLRGHFRVTDAVYCGLLLIPAGVMLLVAGYTWQHAKFVVVMPVVLAGVFVRASPSFAVAMGAALALALLDPRAR